MHTVPFQRPAIDLMAMDKTGVLLRAAVLLPSLCAFVMGQDGAVFNPSASFLPPPVSFVKSGPNGNGNIGISLNPSSFGNSNPPAPGSSGFSFNPGGLNLGPGFSSGVLSSFSTGTGVSGLGAPINPVGGSSGFRSGSAFGSSASGGPGSAGTSSFQAAPVESFNSPGSSSFSSGASGYIPVASDASSPKSDSGGGPSDSSSPILSQTKSNPTANGSDNSRSTSGARSASTETSRRSANTPPRNACTPAPRRFSKFRIQVPQDPLAGFKIVCLFNSKVFYVKNLTFSPSLIDPCLCTHVNYEFAMLDPKTYEMISGDATVDIQENFYQEVIDLKKTNTDLKIMLSLGGWNDSTSKYSTMAADPEKRQNFVEKAVSFLKGHEFDGMDLSWQYPNCWQGAIGIMPKDKKNYVLLLQELKEAFSANNLLLSVSVGAIKREIEAAYDVPGISRNVDHINVMTYDMHGPWESKTGHHTQFEPMSNDRDPYANVKAALQVWIDKGAEKNKLILGLAYYGKTFTLADPANNGLGAPSAGVGKAINEHRTGGTLQFREICEFLNQGNFTEREDKEGGFYAYGVGNLADQWVCYDPPAMMVKKAKYAAEEGLGGVMMKDMSGDDFVGSCFSMPFPLTKMTRFELIHTLKRIKRKG